MNYCKMLSENDGKKLLKLARESISSYFSGKDPDLSKYSEFDMPQGVFVTLTKKKDLRGCIGFPQPTKNLNQAVVEAARAAAFEDPRFPEVKEEELEDITIEISVLTVPEEIKTDNKEELLKKIYIGKDGLIVRQGLNSGLLLPQVFPEHGATAEQALEMTCNKAGLPDDAWKDKSTQVLKFQAQIFCETTSNFITY